MLTHAYLRVYACARPDAEWTVSDTKPRKGICTGTVAQTGTHLEEISEVDDLYNTHGNERYGFDN